MHLNRRVILGTCVAFYAASSIIMLVPAGMSKLASQVVFCIAIVFTALLYYAAYQRERGAKLTQFSLRTIGVAMTLAAVEAWAWRAGQGPLMLMFLISATLIYWRGWIRRNESLSWFSLFLLGLLSLLFLWTALLLGVWLFLGPKIRYDVPITEQKQGILFEKSK